MTKIARLIALWAVAGCALPVSAYQMEVVGPEGVSSAAAPVHTTITQPAPVRPATTGHTAGRGRVYGPTKASETLWSIASRIRPSNRVSVQQTIGALYRLNPSAFELDNLHGLKPGSRLRLPTLSQVRAENTAAVNARLAREKSSWERYSREKQARDRAQAQAKAQEKTAAARNPVTPSVTKPLAATNVAKSNSPERGVPIGTANTASAANSAKKIAVAAATAGVATAAVRAATAEPNLITPLPANSPVAPAAAVTAPNTAQPAVSSPANATSVSNVAERYAALENEPVSTDSPAPAPTVTAAGTAPTTRAPLAQQAQPIVPLAVSAGILANTEQKEAQSLTTAEAKQLRQQLVDSAGEISRLTENNVSLTNQVSELQIRVKQLQIELDNEAAFRKEARQTMAHAEEQAKALELERMKNKMLEASSGSLIQQMSRSWPLAIGVGVIPPVLLGALLWLLYRVRQRRHNAQLSQAFEEHQSKDFGGVAAFALGSDTPDLSRPDDMDMQWEETDSSQHPAKHSAPASVELPEPPSLFASLPNINNDQTSENDAEARRTTRRDEVRSDAVSEDDFDLAHPDSSAPSMAESTELASLVDLDLAHDEMLGGDEIVDVILSTPSLVQGSEADHDDVRLLADMDDEDPVFSLSDEDLFESLSPAAPTASADKADKAQTAVVAPEPVQTKKPEPATASEVATPAPSVLASTALVKPAVADIPLAFAEEDVAVKPVEAVPPASVSMVTTKPELESEKTASVPAPAPMASSPVALAAVESPQVIPVAAASLASATTTDMQADLMRVDSAQPDPVARVDEQAINDMRVSNEATETSRSPASAQFSTAAIADEFDLADEHDQPSVPPRVESTLSQATSTLTAAAAEDSVPPTAMLSNETTPASVVDAADVMPVVPHVVDTSVIESEPESEPFRSETERELAAALVEARQRAPVTPVSENTLSAPTRDPAATAHSASLNLPGDVADADNAMSAMPTSLSDYRTHSSLLTQEEQNQLFAEQLLDLPDMTEADFDLSAPMSEPAHEWRMPLPPEPAPVDEDWAAQDNLMATTEPVTVTPEERDAFTRRVVEGEAQETEADDDLVGKLILARAYLDIDDPEGAQPLLESVLKQGNVKQQEQARKMLLEVA